MPSTDSDHGPKAGCNWQKCGLLEPFDCPFVKDDVKTPFENFMDMAEMTQCAHEWHQVSNDLDHRVYCIYCLTIKKLAIT